MVVAESFGKNSQIKFNWNGQYLPLQFIEGINRTNLKLDRLRTNNSRFRR